MSPTSLPVVPAPAPLVFRRYILCAPAGASIPRFAGASVRGAMGRALRQLVCATHMPVCDGCPVRDACAYAMLHDGHTPPGVHAGTGPNAPPPLWLRDVDGGGLLRRGDRFSFTVAAYGPAIRSLPYVDEAVRSLARVGLGKDRQTMEFLSIEDEVRDMLSTLVEQRAARLSSALRRTGHLTVRLWTPVAIRLRGPGWKDRDRPEPPWPERLAGGAARRRIALERRWFDVPAAAAPRLASAVEDAAGVTVADNRVRIEKVTRYSSTEGRFVDFYGAVGWLRLGGDGLERSLPWLASAEMLSVGSGTTFGFGRISLEVA